METSNIRPNSGQFRSGGGRVSSPQYRQSLQLCEDFLGLEENVDRYDLLLLVKKAGKSAGFTPRMIQLLDYYLAYTRDLDWQEGNRPIIYQSLSRTALDLGVSERQIQKLELQLFKAGALTWHDCGGHKRYGQRDPRTGAIIYAYGVDLTPLAYLRAELEDKLQRKQLYDRAWMETKRQISWYRRQIRAMLLELEREERNCPWELTQWERSYETIAIQIRTHLSLETLRDLLADHKQLHSQVAAILPQSQEQDVTAKTSLGSVPKTCKSSSTSVPQFAHYKSTTQQSFDKSNTDSPADKGFQESVAERPARSSETEKNEARSREGRLDRGAIVEAAGLHHISLKQVLLAASNRFRERLPLEPRSMNWSDVVEAAYRLRPELNISQQNWAEACELLGRNGAAICLLLTDQATMREDTPVLKPAGYFRAMVKRAESGELRLHNSIFGFVVRHV
ncbi:plasmid replication protein RepC [Bremerella sp. JC770]|uniref:plasmid replication protein RepC n=1 Tax=Bremerella sp. JC770 TaxID=3232137 RepID=UPI0034598738